MEVRQSAFNRGGGILPYAPTSKRYKYIHMNLFRQQGQEKSKKDFAMVTLQNILNILLKILSGYFQCLYYFRQVAAIIPCDQAHKIVWKFFAEL